MARFSEIAEWARPLLRMRPVSGRLWLDVVYLLIVGAVHHTVIPSLTRSIVPVDLMTPWIITVLVLEHLPRGAFLALIGALILETHSSAPAGLYVCGYWVIGAVVYLTRSTLSWRHAFPWLVTFTFGQLWIIGFECFVLAVSTGGSLSPLLDFHYVVGQTARLILGIGIGMALCQPFMFGAMPREEAN